MQLFKKIVGLLVLLLLGIEFTQGLSTFSDMTTFDSINYFWSSYYFGQIAFDPDWGPFYSLVIMFFGLFTDSKLEWYYLNQRTMIILLPLAAFLLYSSRIKHRYALVLALPLLYMDSNVLAFTKIFIFSTSVLLLGALFISKRGATFFYCACSMTVLWLVMSYIRPEYYPFFMLSAWVMLAYGLFMWIAHQQRQPLIIMIAIIGCWAMVVGILGAPASGGRSILAFKQTYAQNFLEWNGRHDETRVHEPIVDSVFGNVNTIPEAIASNPAEVWHHWSYNLSKETELAIWKFVDMVLPRLLYAPPNHASDYFVQRLATVVLAVLCLLLLLRKRTTKPNPIPRVWYLFILITTSIGVLISTLFFVDERYFTPLILLLMVAAAFEMENRVQFRWHVLSYLIPGVMLVLILCNRPHASAYFNDGNLIHQQIFLTYDKVQFEHQDVILVPQEFLGIEYPPAITELLKVDSTYQQLQNPAVRAVLTTQLQLNATGVTFHQIPINDTLFLYYSPESRVN